MTPDVLEGKTFSTAGAADQSGSMPDNGAISIVPGRVSQTIAAGCDNGSGGLAGDAELIPGNSRSGAGLFGVSGDANVVDTSSGNVAPADIRRGKRAWADGLLMESRQ